jgi:hypothetical protein
MLKKLYCSNKKYKLYIDKKKSIIQFKGIDFSYRDIVLNCLTDCPKTNDISWDNEILIKNRKARCKQLEYLVKEGVVSLNYLYSTAVHKISIALEFASFNKYPNLELFINNEQSYGAINLDTMCINYHEFRPKIITLFSVNLKKIIKYDK